jgi:hypothetical protein
MIDYSDYRWMIISGEQATTIKMKWFGHFINSQVEP